MYLSRAAYRLLLAGYNEQAAAALRRAIADETFSSRKDRYASDLCALMALAGRDAEAAALPQSGQCQAVRAWQLALVGKTDEALALAGDLSSPRPERQRVLLLLAVQAEAGRWAELQATYREVRTRSHELGDPYGELYELFNDIYSPPVPLSLTRRLQARLEQRLVATSGAGGPDALLLAELLHRVLFIRARQALLAGRPEQARRLLRRVLALAPNYRVARQAMVRLVALLDGPGPAMAEMARAGKYHQPEYEAVLLAAQGRFRRARTVLRQSDTCRGGIGPNSLCTFLRVYIALELKDFGALKADEAAMAAKKDKSPASYTLAETLLSLRRRQSGGPSAGSARRGGGGDDVLAGPEIDGPGDALHVPEQRQHGPG